MIKVYEFITVEGLRSSLFEDVLTLKSSLSGTWERTKQANGVIQKTLLIFLVLFYFAIILVWNVGHFSVQVCTV